MVNDEINLIGAGSTKASISFLNERFFRKAGILSLILVALLAALFFLLGRLLSPGGVQRQQREALKSLELARDKQGALILIGDRVANTTKILNSRRDYSEELNTVFSLTAVGISINSMKVNKDKISLTVLSKSLVSLNDLTNSLVEMAQGKKLVKRLTIDSLVYNEKVNSYLLSLTIDVYEKKR